MLTNKALKRAERELSREMNKQLGIIYPACAVIWWRDYGWRETRILRRFKTSSEIWTECADHGPEKSMLQMLEEETGIEMQLYGYDKSYHEFSYLDGNAWDGKLLTLPQTVYMHNQQKKWMAPLILAGVCLTLHRDEHWGQDRIARFIGQIDELRRTYGEKPDAYKKLMLETTRLTENMLWSRNGGNG